MRVLLARHGQTEWNVLGQLDSPLTAAGIAQAHDHAQTLADSGLDAILASPLGRAAVGLSPVVPDDLAEVVRRSQPRDVIHVVADGKVTPAASGPRNPA
jgi:broad specificity phosphatase PhoE